MRVLLISMASDAGSMVPLPLGLACVAAATELEISVPARTLTLPPLREGPPDVARMMGAAAKYDIEITGPPPKARS